MGRKRRTQTFVRVFADKHSAGDHDKRSSVIAEAMTKDEEKMKGAMVTAAVRKIEDLSVEIVFQFEIEGGNLNFLPVGYTYYEECRRIL